MINLVKFFFFSNLFFSFALIGASAWYSRELNIKGKTKNLKHAAVETGLPGKPKKAVLDFILENKIGLPGLILAPLK